MDSEKKMVAFIACAGDAAGKSRRAGFASCEEAANAGVKRGECRVGCLGVGSCVAACTKGAMSIVDGKVTIDKEKCDGCGDCAKEGVCPRGLISMIPADATNTIPCSSTEEDDFVVRHTCNFGCIGCGECERVCPEHAIKIINSHAVIDYSKCVSCAACTVKCKKKIIVDTAHDITKLKENVAFVKCSGDGRTSDMIKAMGYNSCKEAARRGSISLDLCPSGCLGCGDCTKYCRYDAIHIIDGVAVVDPDKCVGCKACMHICPRHLIKLVPYKGMKMVACSSIDPIEVKEKYCSSGCIFCEACISNCPNNAIYSEDLHMTVDPELCEDCNICQYVCPTGTVKRQEVPEYIYIQREALRKEQEELAKNAVKEELL